MLHQICTLVDGLVIQQRLGLKDGEGLDMSDPSTKEAINQMPSFFLMKLILNQFLPKALKQ